MRRRDAVRQMDSGGTEIFWVSVFQFHDAVERICDEIRRFGSNTFGLSNSQGTSSYSFLCLAAVFDSNEFKRPHCLSPSNAESRLPPSTNNSPAGRLFILAKESIRQQRNDQQYNISSATFFHINMLIRTVTVYSAMRCTYKPLLSVVGCKLQGGHATCSPILQGTQIAELPSLPSKDPPSLSTDRP